MIHSDFQSIYESIITSLIKQDYAVVDHFFDDSILVGLHEQILLQIEEDNLRLAGIGTGSDFDKNKDIRRDKIKWISNTSKIEVEQEFLSSIDDFSTYLNQTCYAGIRGQEFHYACYEIGAFYKRHLDQFKSDDSRKYSMITYLNKNWEQEQGGQLTLFLDGKEIDIQPEWGRTVFLKSDVIEHEVKLSHRKRLSVTGWLR